MRSASALRRQLFGLDALGQALRLGAFSSLAFLLGFESQKALRFCFSRRLDALSFQALCLGVFSRTAFLLGFEARSPLSGATSGNAIGFCLPAAARCSASISLCFGRCASARSAAWRSCSALRAEALCLLFSAMLGFRPGGGELFGLDRSFQAPSASAFSGLAFYRLREPERVALLLFQQHARLPLWQRQVVRPRCAQLQALRLGALAAWRP